MAAAAPAAGKGKRKRHLFEDDVYLLLHRYAPGTILTALQEVAQHAEDWRIDWRAVVGKWATGITSAREYQMLWRHFAYHHDLDDSFDDGDQPLGDDSDLELELEPNPIPTKEALSEASALVKDEREAPACVAFALPFFNTLFYHDQVSRSVLAAYTYSCEQSVPRICSRLQSIRDCLDISDWATRKAAADTLCVFATHSGHLTGDGTAPTVATPECFVTREKP